MPGYGTLSMAWEVAGSKRPRSCRGSRALPTPDHHQIRGQFSEAGAARPVGELTPADSGPWALSWPVVTGALPVVSWRIVWTAWSPQLVVLLVSVGLLVWYLRLARQFAAEWQRSRTWSWCVGIASFVWVGSGFPQVYDRSLLLGVDGPAAGVSAGGSGVAHGRASDSPQLQPLRRPVSPPMNIPLRRSLIVPNCSLKTG